MNNRKAIVLNDKSVKTIGRTYLYNDTLWAAFSGAGAEFIFTGKKLEITVTGDFASTAGNDENYARIAIYVDNERVVDDMLDEKEKTYKVLESESAECRNVRVIKLSECAMSTFGIKPVMIAENEKIEPAPAKNIKMEFIGDSITCGYGVDDPDKEHHFKTATEDVTKAYAYKTALALNADYSMVSVSGYGIISGFTNDGNKIPEQTIPQYYDKLGFSYNKFADSITVSETEWDFERYKPDIIVINLGTNDMNYATTDERKAEFEDGYLDFLKKVRSLNSDSYIFQTYGVMGTSLEENIENVRRKYISETGDERITFIPLTMQDWEKRLNSFIEMFDYGILQDAGKVSAEITKLHAETEFEKYRVIQDRLFMSDFDKYMLELEENAKK
jgi:lysophospholipase L1-like esterase